MSDLSIRPEDISSAIQQMLDGYEPSLAQEQVGRVVDTGDGIATITGLPGTLANELLDFGGGVFGMAMNLDEHQIGAAVFAPSASVEEGQTVRRTDRVLSVPVGAALLGRVVDALGNPIDGKGPIVAAERRRVDVKAPGIIPRKSVHEPMSTGLKAIDALIPIGRGQRELIIGDRQTGKTAIAIDTIINQKQLWGTPDAVKCIYVAIGQKGSTVAEVVATLERFGAMEYTTVVSAPASSPAPFQYIAPYAGAAIGANWMYAGDHSLIIYDDLSKQADAYRQLSLLLRRPPGREADPGDVFYLHSRLLERAAKLSDELGGGSMTALPIVETKANDVSAYIPTNVISITDGQIFLETDLFYQGVRPAMNAGISVSRVGGDAQVPAMKKISGRVRLDLAQYRELEAFAQFGSELDRTSQRQLARGERVVEVLKQPQYQPMSVDRQIVSIYAVTNGYLDDVAIEDVRRFEEELLRSIETRHPGIGGHLAEKGDLPDEVESNLKDAIADFKRAFQPSAEAAPTSAGPGGGPVDERREDVGWERIGEPEPDEEEPKPMTEEEYEAEAGPVGDTDSPAPG
jgi:F-type H+-transporting ATPase subunit alpha